MMTWSPGIVAAWLVLLRCTPLTLAQQQPQPTPCFRWSGQVSLANGPNGQGNSTSTLWYYGGQAKTDPNQDSNWWTNALVSLDLTRDWATGTPPLTLVQADNGDYSNPPAVSLGALWSSNDGNKLYVYGGQFSDNPDVNPPPLQVYSYDISAGQWSAVSTSGDSVTRPAEGSPALVPKGGSSGDNLGYFFSGHLDDHTVHDWSNQIPRKYLNSLVTFDLGSLTFRNITNYSSSGSTSNTSTPATSILYRADGTLTYVPGLGTDNKGIMVAIGGATDTSYIDDSVLDVFDIGAGGWTKQAVGGTTMGSRVNHCAVRASAVVEGTTTHQIFVYGGQKLNQTDRDSAVYILNIKDGAYDWVFVGDNLPGQPAGRAGHQCVLQGSQLIVVGGLVSTNTLCDQPGIYVYDTSQSAWESNYKHGTLYSTPQIIANLTGGTGQSTDPGNTGTDVGSGGSNGSGSGGGKSSIGAIVGGVVGGIVALALLLLLLVCWRRRKAKAKATKHNGPHGMVTGRKSGGIFSTPSHSSNGSTSIGGATGSPGYHHGPLPLAHEKQPFMTSTTSPFLHPVRTDAADDDVEDSTRGMEAAFANPHLVPKRTLRVVNRDEEEDV